MKSTMIPVVLISLSCGTALAEDELNIVHPLTDEQIDSALGIGKDTSEDVPKLSFGTGAVNWGSARSDTNRRGHFFESSLSRGSRSSGFGVELYTPYSWLIKIARDSKMKGHEMLKRHVTEPLLEPVLRVICYSDVPQERREGAFGNRVEEVFIRPANKKLKETITPIQVSRIPQRYWTPSGESVDVGPLQATFTLTELYSISSLDKKGEFYVSMVAADGEQKEFKVKSKHFKMLP